MTATATETFPPEHYDTAKHFGIPNFADAWGQTAVELSLTVEALQRQGVTPTFTENDLIGYYFVHYGGDNEITAEAIGMAKEEGEYYLAQYAQPLKDAVPTLLGDAMPRPVEFGRIALRGSRVRDIAVDESLAETTDRVEIRGGAETGEYAGAKQFGEFLYPKPGVVLHYLGRSSIDLMQENPRGFIKQGRGGGLILNQLAFHVDSFSVTSFNDDNCSTRERTNIYQALSYDESSHSTLTAIKLVGQGAPRRS